jgi:hypothetical protein
MAATRKKTGIQKFDIIGFDACLMGSLEVLSMTAPYADYAVLSQETEPSMGWAYTAFLKKLTSNPKIDPAELSKTSSIHIAMKTPWSPIRKRGQNTFPEPMKQPAESARNNWQTKNQKQ